MTRTVGSGNDISIHSLRMEGDIKETPKTSMKSFQSTPSAWRETIGVVETVTPIWDFNPLPPHGGRRTFLLMLLLHRTFQSTPSAWRETDRIHDGRNSEAISIHSLRMEGDEFLHTIPAFCGHFNPLPPHGGRLRCFQNILLMFTFQSTPSAWRETLFRKTILQASSFQSTPSAWRETAVNCCLTQ